MTTKFVPASSKKDIARLARLIPRAQQSNCFHKHAAACYRGGRLLSTGKNKDKTNGYNRFITLEHPCSEHAEVAAVRQIEDVSNIVVYVMRIRRDGVLGYSEPCPQCQEYLKQRGVKKVIYSDNIENY